MASRFAEGFQGQAGDDGRLDTPAFHRNNAAIWSVLAPWLRTQSGEILEVGSGSGQHVVAFARQSPHLVWWPADLDEQHLRSIDAWRRQSGLENVRPPHRVDLAAPDWGLAADVSDRLRGLTAIFCANVVHIAPWAVAEGLLGQAAGRLRPDGRLYLYGPFKREGAHTAPSNAAFDAKLRARDPSWGVRDVGDLEALGRPHGLALVEIVPMPSNNFILVFEHRAAGR